MMKAVCMLESYGIVHRDLKPDNIIIRKQKNQNLSQSMSDLVDCTVCIIDFGVSTDLSVKKPHRDGCGTVGYMAPETIPKKEVDARTLRVTSKVDVYSAGIIFYEM